MAPLLSLSLVLSACTISVFADESADHDHEPGTGEHDHGEGEATGIDHHGNPIYDEEERVYEQVTADGVSVEFTVENFIGVGGRGGELAPRLVEGEHANLQFRITDDSGDPLAGLNPAVWVDPAVGDAECSNRVQGYLSGTLDSRPAIDLNSYFVLGMNRDSTISVIDPMIDVGGMTNLFSVIILQAAAQDWAMASDRARLFATMPDLNKVAVVDLNAFLVEDNVDLGGLPDQIALEPGGGQVWVTLGDDAGVAVIDAATLDVDTIDLAAATGAIAFTAAGDRALVGTTDGVVIVDTATRRATGRVTLAGPAAAAAVSSATGAAYVVQPDAGAISIVDPGTGVETGRLLVDRGVSDIAISRDGHWGVAVNRDTESAYILEITRGRITHEIPVGGAPGQVKFTADAAYIHTSGSPSITVIPLAEIDPAGDVSVLTVPIGNRPFGDVGVQAIADAITVTPDGSSLLIPNPADDTVYFYTEGSQEALGGFQGHTLQPRAVQVVDRSLKEPSPGVYTGSIRIPRGGEFVVAFLLEAPRLVHCFSFEARAAEEPLEGIAAAAADLRVLSEGTTITGEAHELRFELRDSSTDELLSGLKDVRAMVVQTGGNWSARLTASPWADGIYTVNLVPPAPGLYKVLFTVPSLGLDFEQLPQVSLEATS